MTEEVFHKFGNVLDSLEAVMRDSGEYESDIRSSYSDLDDLYKAIKEVYGYKDNSDN